MSMAGAGGALVGAKTAPPPPLAAKAAIPFPEVFARDAIIAWFRGEFAAANAIIDALLSHLNEISERESAAGDYEAVFSAIHRRRMNWIPVIHMQTYFSIADVSIALRRAAAARISAEIEEEEQRELDVRSKDCSDVVLNDGTELGEAVKDGNLPAFATVNEEDEDEEKEDEETEDDSGNSPVNDDGGSSLESRESTENGGIWSEEEDPLTRPDRIRTVKGFVAKEPVKGHMVNVVKGLKLYEDIFTGSELLKLTEFVNQLRLSGRRGELSGSTFMYFNQQLKGNKREIIQLGTPIFQPTKDDASSQIEPIPNVLQSVIEHLVQWRLIPEARRPNSCIINFFDEDEHSQPYFKPPHLDNPVSTLVLSETNMAFGRFLVGDHHGVYKGSLSLSLKDGSLLVMRGNSAELARHVICPSPSRRISITFVKVRSTDTPQAPKDPNSLSPTTKSPSFWSSTCIAHEMVAAPPPVVLVAPPPGRRLTRPGTGVFLPWTSGPKKYHKHVPPRIQRRRLAALLPAPVEAAG